MLILTIEQATPGMTLAAPVSDPEHPNRELLRRGYRLERPIINRLKSLGVGYLFVDYPGLDELDKYLAPLLCPERQQLYARIKETIDKVQKQTRPQIRYGDYVEASRSFLQTLLDQGRNPIFMDQMSRMTSDEVGHSTAVAHLSLLLGLKLEAYLIRERRWLAAHNAKDVLNLGVAGMLHDIGKHRIAAEARSFTCMEPPPNDDLRKQWEEHPRESYELVRHDVGPAAASAILHHHQRFDGQGFPATLDTGTRRRVAPDEHRIHIFARILAAADVYDRLTSLSADGSRRTNLEALHLMRTLYRSWFDPIVLDTLHTICPPFPPGSRVELSDGSQAIVTGFDPADPFRPCVKRFDRDGMTIVDEVIHLHDNNAPEIVSTQGVRVEGMIPDWQPTPIAA